MISFIYIYIYKYQNVVFSTGHKHCCAVLINAVHDLQNLQVVGDALACTLRVDNLMGEPCKPRNVVATWLPGYRNLALKQFCSDLFRSVQ